MSHFTVMVIGNNPEKQLKPYDENKRAKRYSSPVSEDEVKRFMEYYKDKNEGTSDWDFRKMYKKFGKDWNFGVWQETKNGVIEWSTYNPKSKWDWYQLGGRWAGRIKVKEGVSFEPPNFSWGWEEEYKKEMLSEPRTDRAKKKDIANLSELTAFAVLMNGEWHGNGEMGWFGISHGETMTGDEWKSKVQELLNGLPDNTLISMYDCHI